MKLNRITKVETTTSSLAFAKPFVSGSAFMVCSVAQLKILARLYFIFWGGLNLRNLLFYNNKKQNTMALQSSKQRLANLIQTQEQVVACARTLFDDTGDIRDWAIQISLNTQEKIKEAKKKLKDNFSIDYDTDTAKTKVIKEGSSVEVLVNHMDGMKGSTAIIKSYSLPANISDITMKDGMKMNGHKWLTNDEVKLK